VAELPFGGEIDIAYLNRFSEMVNNNLDTAKALAVIWELIKDRKIIKFVIT